MPLAAIGQLDVTLMSQRVGDISCGRESTVTLFITIPYCMIGLIRTADRLFPLTDITNEYDGSPTAFSTYVTAQLQCHRD